MAAPVLASPPTAQLVLAQRRRWRRQSAIAARETPSYSARKVSAAAQFACESAPLVLTRTAPDAVADPVVDREPQAMPLDRTARAHGAGPRLASSAYRGRFVRHAKEQLDVHAAARGRLLPGPFGRRRGERGGCLNAHTRSTHCARHPFAVQGLHRSDVAAVTVRAQR